MQPILLWEIQDIVYKLAQYHFHWDEPIPPFETRYSGKLESCLDLPFQTYDGQDLYPTLTDKAAALFYMIIKNHPFQNGNKRVAVLALTLFLFKNAKWITMSRSVLYDLALTVAKSEDSKKDATLRMIKDTLDKNLIDEETNEFEIDEL